MYACRFACCVLIVCGLTLDVGLGCVSVPRSLASSQMPTETALAVQFTSSRSWYYKPDLLLKLVVRRLPSSLLQVGYTEREYPISERIILSKDGKRNLTQRWL